MPRAGTDEALEDYLAGFYSQWQTNDANGRLVSGLGVATLDANGKAKYQTLDTRSGKFKPEPLLVTDIASRSRWAAGPQEPCTSAATCLMEEGMSPSK